MDDCECLRKVRALCMAYGYSVLFTPGEAPVMCTILGSAKQWDGWGETAAKAFAMALERHDAQEVKKET